MKRSVAFVLSFLLLPALSAVRAQEVSVIAPPSAKEEVTCTPAVGTPGTVVNVRTECPIPKGWIQTGETSILDPESGEWRTEPVYGLPPASLSDLYVEGGYGWMTGITLCLIAMLFAAWKAPRWVKEFGLLAMVIGFFSMLLGFYSVANFIHTQGIEIGKELSGSVLFGGLRIALIAPMYALIVYAVSLTLRIALKPRI